MLRRHSCLVIILLLSLGTALGSAAQRRGDRGRRAWHAACQCVSPTARAAVSLPQVWRGASRRALGPTLGMHESTLEPTSLWRRENMADTVHKLVMAGAAAALAVIPVAGGVPAAEASEADHRAAPVHAHERTSALVPHWAIEALGVLTAARSTRRSSCAGAVATRRAVARGGDAAREVRNAKTDATEVGDGAVPLPTRLEPGVEED